MVQGAVASILDHEPTTPSLEIVEYGPPMPEGGASLLSVSLSLELLDSDYTTIGMNLTPRLFDSDSDSDLDWLWRGMN